MNTTSNELFQKASDMDKPFAVGAARGICLGISLTIALLLLGATLPEFWRWAFHYAGSRTSAESSDIRAPFQAATVHSAVPFIPLSFVAIQFALNSTYQRQEIEKEMRGRLYFEAEPLKGRTHYLPKLRDQTNLRSTIIFTNGQMKMIVVQLVPDDGAPGRLGLLPADEYEDDIRSIGK